MIMTDLGMPGMNGWEVAREIRSINTEIPIILMTGWGLEISNKEVKNAGITELVAKPFTIRKVQALVTKYLSKPVSPPRP
jgi:CheY-like chemotaxis protein